MCLDIKLSGKKFKKLHTCQSKKDLKKAAELLKKTAKKPIIIYKVLEVVDKKTYSPFQGKLTKLDTMLKSKFSFESFSDKEINVYRGLHCFTMKRYALQYHTNGWGFNKYCKIFRGYIPKGAEYYVSSDGTQIVSNYMVIEEKSYSL